MSYRHFLFYIILAGLTMCICRNEAYGMKNLQDAGIADNGSEMDFIKYLMARGDFSEALFLLDELKVLSAPAADTVFYLKGWALYQQKVLLPSAGFLLQVSADSPLYSKSRFFGAYNLAHTGKYGQARQAINAMPTIESGFLPAMKDIQLSGIALLERDFDSFSNLSDKFSGRYQAFADQEQSMMKHHQALSSHQHRSPVIAGMLSSVIPGLGKFYIGKKGEGIAGLLYTAALGATAFDFYKGSGPKSALFIVTGTVATVFYIGNIWGSITAVHRKNREFNYEIDQRILYDMHIPLRNAFN